MNPSARLAAAIEVLGVTEEQRRPVAEVLRDWGRTHRFAGSKDRAAIADLAYDAMRVRASSAWVMGDDSPRGVMLGALRRVRGLDAEAIAGLCQGQDHAPAALTAGERARLEADSLDGAPAHVLGDYPEWLAPSLDAAFGDEAGHEGAALSRRAPVDLRVNGLKGDRAKALRALAHLDPVETPHSPVGIRLARGANDRTPAMVAEPAYAKGLVEVQDEGSQIAALLGEAMPGQQVLDLCAGGGGKTLALAAQMGNKGQIYAADSDGRRLAPIYDRLARADVRNAQVRAPRGEADVLGDLAGRCDLVLVDAPCTGTGTWRRNPDAKWRLRPGALEQRIKAQDEVLDQAVRFLKPGGRLLFVTCSFLKEENEDRVAALLGRQPELLPIDAAVLATRAGLPALAEHASRHGPGLRLSPLRTGTDGFYIASLLRVAG
ncbi:RsmB/NOP family class I SAM-dependent RNA methyltransferase [Lichenihabitans sp. Uapishka_5]|uniref:RsmB/NOP family class I SAM-dependent RNA methyltransferase n=1 Tax=Lichenihabitans sp. Uapishka_5 TaxID=3037302 RepID=UPI0029E809A8|nr:RsmB/NOP family class I SAM-dependent RNA methyltransferase [Lichenihabitans sp. Uapishka_5]MDX7951940.1 RsmB/NOP family class I SAM-dependent RNA methyltransferase [Lichenihabitans sp. Uapishka_5]